MRFVLVAVLFLLAIAAFTLIAHMGYRSSVEAEFRERSLAALREAELDGVEVNYDHHHAKLAGYVESAAEREKAIAVVGEAVPSARLPGPDETDVSIRPTLPPEIRIVRREGENRVQLSGLLGADGDANRKLLGSRLHSLNGIQAVDNDIELDPKRLPFRHTAELASLAAGLIDNSETVEVVLSEGTLRVAGVVPNDGLEEAMLGLAERIGAERIVDEIDVSEPVSFREKSTLKMTRNRFGVTLTGTVASVEARDRLMRLLEKSAEGGRVSERLDIDEEVVAGPWEEYARTLLPLLLSSFVGEMTAEFTAERVRLVGKMKKEGKRDALLAAFDPLRQAHPQLEILSDVSVAEAQEEKEGPPLRLLAVFEEGLVSIDGNVPDDAFLASLEQRVESEFPDTLVKNTVKVTPHSPGKQWLGDLTELLLEFLTRVESGVVSIQEQRVRLEGETASVADPQILENVAINTVPSRFSVDNRLSHAMEAFPQPSLQPEVRTKLAETLGQFPVYFGSNSEVIDEDELEKLDEIVNALESVEPRPDLVVTGFADNVGDEEYNRQLSLRRAGAVVKALSSRGIPEDAMSTESVGEDVSDVSRSQRWKARRVEVSLAPPEEPGKPRDSSQETPD